MAKTSIFLPVIIVVLSSCNMLEKDKAIRFNNKIVRINDSLTYKGENWGKEIAAAWVSKDFSIVDSMHKDLVGYIEIKKAEISRLENTSGSEQMKQMELDFLNFEKQMIQSAAVFGTFDSSTTQDEFISAYNKLLYASAEEKARLENLKEIQKAFATENKLPLKER